MSSLIWGITRIVPEIKEKAATNRRELLVYEFVTAYEQLRASCPNGDLRIHLSVEGSREAVGFKNTQAE